MKKYTLKTVNDFLAIPEDKIAACLVDFEAWLQMARNEVAVNASLDALAGQAGAVRFDATTVDWVDDGIVGVSAMDICSDGKVIATIAVEAA